MTMEPVNVKASAGLFPAGGFFHFPRWLSTTAPFVAHYRLESGKAGMEMQPIDSSLTGTRGTFGYFRESLEPNGFTLANWDYHRGFFDRKLDDQGMVYLRLPVTVKEGELDSPDAWLELGTPFVLKHVYQTGVEEDIGYYVPVASAAMNQFQEPADKDAPVEQVWMRKAEAIVRELEKRFA